FTPKRSLVRTQYRPPTSMQFIVPWVAFATVLTVFFSGRSWQGRSSDCVERSASPERLRDDDLDTRLTKLGHGVLVSCGIGDDGVDRGTVADSRERGSADLGVVGGDVDTFGMLDEGGV